MIRIRLLVVALVLGTGLFVASSSSAEARPYYHRVYRAPVYCPPVCVPAPVVTTSCVPINRTVYRYGWGRNHIVRRGHR